MDPFSCHCLKSYPISRVSSIQSKAPTDMSAPQTFHRQVSTVHLSQFTLHSTQVDNNIHPICRKYPLLTQTSCEAAKCVKMLASGELSGQPEVSQSDRPTPRILTILAVVLEKLVARNDQLVDGLSNQGVEVVGKSLNAFHGVKSPSISIVKYMERIYKYTSCSPACFVVGYVYIDRLAHKHPQSLVLSLNVHRLLVTSVMVASKILDDEHYNNAFYARVGGVSNAELNRLEMELLFLLDFGVMVSSNVFETYCLHLEKEMLLNGVVPKIEKGILFNNADLVTELSMDDTQTSSSPPQIPDS